LVSEPGNLFDILAVQAVVQVAIKVAEEYLSGGEELSKALKNLFFERSEKISIQKQEEKARKEKKDQVMVAAAAEVRRANQLIYDEIAAREPSPVIQMPGMIDRRTSEGSLENSTTI